MANSTSIKDKTPADAAVMLSEMSDENYKALMTIIIHVYNDDKAAQNRSLLNTTQEQVLTDSSGNDSEAIERQKLFIKETAGKIQVDEDAINDMRMRSMI